MSRVRENRMHGSMGGDWKRSKALAKDAKKNSHGGKPPGKHGFVTYRQNNATAPVLDPT